MQIYYISTFYPLSQVSFLTIKPYFQTLSTTIREAV